MYNCSSCDLQTICRNELEAHISAIHFDCTPYECELCPHSKFPTEFAIRKHFENDHQLEEYYIKFKVSPKIALKKMQISKCVNESSCYQYENTNSSTSIELLTFQADPHVYQNAAVAFCAGSHVEDASATVQPVDDKNFLQSTQTDLGVLEGYSSNSEVLEIPANETTAHDQTSSNTPIVRIHKTTSFAKPDNLLDNTCVPESSSCGVEQAVKEEEIVHENEHGRTGMEDRVELAAMIKNILKLRLFDQTSQLTALEEVECKKCGEFIPDHFYDVFYHINTRHLKLVMYECKECLMPFYWMRKAAVLHVENQHFAKNDTIQDNSEKHWVEINVKKFDYFPSSKCFSREVRSISTNLSQTEREVQLDGKVADKSSNDQTTHEPKKRRGGKSKAKDLLTKTDSTVSLRRLLLIRKDGKKMVKCKKCETQVKRKSWPMLHHANSHCQLALYECKACNKMFYHYSKGHMSKHVNKEHGGKKDLIVDKRKSCIKILEAECSKLFFK
uniref:C2H2-type domain-containing protein n=1 Tax=Ditylenchus dipsaci TaxID=166011 RepID=A0A915DB51_9BILA